MASPDIQRIPKQEAQALRIERKRQEKLERGFLRSPEEWAAFYQVPGAQIKDNVQGDTDRVDTQIRGIFSLRTSERVPITAVVEPIAERIGNTLDTYAIQGRPHINSHEEGLLGVLNRTGRGDVQDHLTPYEQATLQLIKQYGASTIGKIPPRERTKIVEELQQIAKEEYNKRTSSGKKTKK